MARKTGNQELTKEMIVEVADRQFKQFDFHQVSMRSIAKELNCSHGAIYYHFENKTKLFDAVVEKYFNLLNQELVFVLQHEPITGTKKAFENFIQFGLTYPSQYEFMFVKRADGLDPLAQPAALESYEKFRDTLQTLHNHTLNERKIYSTFMSLHGFVLCYQGRYSSLNAIKQAINFHCEYLIQALVH